MSEKLTKKCQWCNKEFKKPYNVSRNGFEKRKFCSQKCKYQYMSDSLEIRKKHKVSLLKRYTSGEKLGFQKKNRLWDNPNSIKTQLKKGRKALKGEESPSWKGGKYISNGYIYIKNWKHPFTTKGHYIAEHRLVMEKYLGRYLERWELIHHKNGRRDDNRIENLEIVINTKHYGHIQCPFCHKEFLIK
jgi:hypothetical protein